MKHLFQIKDDAGSEFIQPVLFLCIGEKYISYAIVDNNTKRVEQIAFDSMEELNISSLDEWYSYYSELNNNFSKVQVSINFTHCTFMSLGDFQQVQGKEDLRSLLGVFSSFDIFSEQLTDWQLVNIFSIPAPINYWISQKFPIVTYKHHFSVQIRTSNVVFEGGSFLIDFRPEEFSLVVMKQSKFLLAQTFSYTQPEDVIFYLMKIIQQFSFSPQEVIVQLTGLIDKQSELFKELRQYFVNIEFREGDWILPESIYPTHFFTSLNDLARCAS